MRPRLLEIDVASSDISELNTRLGGSPYVHEGSQHDQVLGLDPSVLRAAREEAGLTQHELARLVGVAGGERISRWELGASVPRPDFLGQACWSARHPDPSSHSHRW
ncbi:helix-turn-helix domain-containing protein [Nocardioides endophyticus]|uniref:helix-turn-helix domain-containing protein n=1 Tax=Nocardioides endophyticus TaxID=1353775 RepID=UPI003CD09DFC